MAKKINENWALIESMGYTIREECFRHYFTAVPGVPSANRLALGLWVFLSSQARRSVESSGLAAWAAARKGGVLDRAMATMIEDTPALRAEQRRRNALAGVLVYVNEHWDFIKRTGWRGSDGQAPHVAALRHYMHTFMILPFDAFGPLQEVEPWATAPRGSALDSALLAFIEATPALLAERERRALAAIIPATPTATRRQSGRL
ncbi:hypothetical protein [Janthinobacterium sp. PSPC2-1]|uniref:hypothetical protein n=1 Tax=unclassified Janthinobacterium TaxID=2610881 RepID=UPI003CFBA20B